MLSFDLIEYNDVVHDLENVWFENHLDLLAGEYI